MNFFPGQLTADGVSTPIGEVRLPAAAQSKIAGSGSGKDVVVGIRPEHFEDVALVDAAQKPHGGTFTVDVDVLESMGSDKYAYFLAGGPAVNSRELEELAADSGTAVAGGGQLVARLSSESTVAQGRSIDLWFDPAKIAVFDGGTGANLLL